MLVSLVLLLVYASTSLLVSLFSAPYDSRCGLSFFYFSTMRGNKKENIPRVRYSATNLYFKYCKKTPHYIPITRTHKEQQSTYKEDELGLRIKVKMVELFQCTIKK